LLEDILHYLEKYDLSPEHVIFELTESGDIENDSSILSLMDSFYENNLKLAIDDFGTGYSNLRYLQYLKVNVIKIDRSFVCKAIESNYDYTLIKHIIELAHSIDLKVCLEGVETNDEKDVLNVLRPDYIQGYLFGKPMPEKDFKSSFFE
jgi:EAL domain-containing protein (putative c-di-GMP-specific phosphodiesterase class I)